MARMFGTDGVRGVAGRDLTSQLAYALGQAGTVVLAKEGESLKSNGKIRLIQLVFYPIVGVFGNNNNTILDFFREIFEHSIYISRFIYRELIQSQSSKVFACEKHKRHILNFFGGKTREIQRS